MSSALSAASIATAAKNNKTAAQPNGVTPVTEPHTVPHMYTFTIRFQYTKAHAAFPLAAKWLDVGFFDNFINGENKHKFGPMFIVIVWQKKDCGEVCNHLPLTIMRAKTVQKSLDTLLGLGEIWFPF